MEANVSIPVDVILDNVVVAVVSVDNEGIIRSFNSEAERLFQFAISEIIGQPIDVLMPRALFQAGDSSALNNANLFPESDDQGLGGDGYAKRKDGSEFPFELGVNPTIVDGKPMVVGIIRDISKRVEAQKQLLSEKRRLDAVMETVIDGLVIFDELGKIQTFNRSAERILGYQENEITGQLISLLVPEMPEGGESLFQYLQQHFAGDVHENNEVQAKRKDGSLFPIELGVNQMEVDGEKLFVGSVRDITERKEAEDSINEYVGLLKQSNKELDEFAYIASHDLKEPLRGLSNNSLFLEEDYAELLDDDGRRRLARMRFLCHRLEKLIDNLLYFSRLGRQELAIQDVDLNTVIDDVKALLQGSLDDANAELVVNSRLPIVNCDVPRLTEVFHNLITNALKYNDKDEKQIEVGTEQVPVVGHPGQFETAFYVKDNGMGIDPQFHESIFRIFKRLNLEKDETKGTGVGLTFVKKIIERHGGRIWIESELGEGTSFLFTLHDATKPHQVSNQSEE